LINSGYSSNTLDFVACFSRQSLAREVSHQNEELALAIEQMRLRRPDRPWLIPLRFDECEIPDWDIGGGRTLSTIQRVDAFGGRTADETRRLVSAVRQILGQDAEGPSPAQARHGEPEYEGTPLGWPMRQVSDPFQFEVHRAIGTDTADLPVLPDYVQREHDQLLGAVVARAASGTSGLAVLVGDSSTGKTRACWEALRQLRDASEEWRLWHPIDPTGPDAVLHDLARIGPRTVVWLNETQHYLLTYYRPEGEHVAAGLRELLRTPGRGPVLVLGTLWPAYWDILSAVPDPSESDAHAQARQLLKGSSIRVAEAFTAADLHVASRQAIKSGDPRLAEALDLADAGRLTQYLAGGPALLDRYDNAGPAARAILDAAIDVRRLGGGPVLPRPFLEEAASGYLSDEQWDLLAGDWQEHAFRYLTDSRPCRGARAPLTRIRSRPNDPPSPAGEQPAYRLADYLEQHHAQRRSEQRPPDGFWQIAKRHAVAASMYCIKCRKNWIVFYERLTMKNGEPAMKARCGTSGTGMYKIGKREQVIPASE